MLLTRQLATRLESQVLNIWKKEGCMYRVFMNIKIRNKSEFDPYLENYNCYLIMSTTSGCQKSWGRSLLSRRGDLEWNLGRSRDISCLSFEAFFVCADFEHLFQTPFFYKKAETRWYTSTDKQIYLYYGSKFLFEIRAKDSKNKYDQNSFL